MVLCAIYTYLFVWRIISWHYAPRNSIIDRLPCTLLSFSSHFEVLRPIFCQLLYDITGPHLQIDRAYQVYFKDNIFFLIEKYLPWPFCPPIKEKTFNHSIYIQNSKLIACLMLQYIRFLPGWSGGEIKFTVNVVLPKRPQTSLNWISKVNNRR